jgi:Rad3-related DNA helicase
MKYIENNFSRAEADEWYSIQSFKALNQTLGRAIRNKNDYAIILLLDQRYAKEEYIKKFSSWFSKCLRNNKC